MKQYRYFCFFVVCIGFISGCGAPRNNNDSSASIHTRKFKKKGAPVVPRRNTFAAGTLRQKVESFEIRFLNHYNSNRTPCCAQLVKDFPDLALASFRLRSRTGSKKEIIKPLALIWLEAMGSNALLDSELRRLNNPQSVQPALKGLFAAEKTLWSSATDSKLIGKIVRSLDQIIDTLNQENERFHYEDARQLRITGLLSLLPKDKSIPDTESLFPGPSAPTKEQQSKRRLLQMRLALESGRTESARNYLETAMTSIGNQNHEILLGRLEEARPLVFQQNQWSPQQQWFWERRLCRFYLKRKNPLKALRHALAARLLSSDHPVGELSNHLEDRLLTARAQLASKRPQSALSESLNTDEVAEKRKLLKVQAAALDVTGSVLTSMGRQTGAINAYKKAFQLCKNLKDAKNSIRISLNLAKAYLKAGLLQDGKGTLAIAGEQIRNENNKSLSEYTWTQSLYHLAGNDKTQASGWLKLALKSATQEGRYGLVEKILNLQKQLGMGTAYGAKSQPNTN